ncbi:hypothetical protein D3C80_2000210 [compost metagenome]
MAVADRIDTRVGDAGGDRRQAVLQCQQIGAVHRYAPAAVGQNNAGVGLAVQGDGNGLASVHIDRGPADGQRL